MNFENVQPGDTLIWNGNSRRLIVVNRITKTQLITCNGRFRKSDGYRIGTSKWNLTNVTIPKPGEIEEIHDSILHRHFVERVNDACQIRLLHVMSLETLRQLNTILEAQ